MIDERPTPSAERIEHDKASAELEDGERALWPAIRPEAPAAMWCAEVRYARTFAGPESRGPVDGIDRCREPRCARCWYGTVWGWNYAGPPVRYQEAGNLDRAPGRFASSRSRAGA